MKVGELYYHRALGELLIVAYLQNLTDSEQSSAIFSDIGNDQLVCFKFYLLKSQRSFVGFDIVSRLQQNLELVSNDL